MKEKALAKAWEALAVVRKRFRVGADWVHRPTNSEGEDCLIGNLGLKANSKILIAMVEVLGIDKIGVDALQTEASCHPLQTFFCLRLLVFRVVCRPGLT